MKYMKMNHVCSHCGAAEIVKAPIGVWYEYMQIKFAEHGHRGENILPYNEVIKFLNFYRIPKQMKPVILQEMELMKMLQTTNEKIKVINCNYDESEYANLNKITKRKRQVELIC